MTMVDPSPQIRVEKAALPRIGFAGAGWIGRHRMKVLLEGGLCEAVAIAEPDRENASAAAALAPTAEIVPSFETLLDRNDLDALVIATPSAAHADQSIAALERGLAVFCQKPLGRNAREVAAVVETARRADRLLGVDLSYRHTAAMAAIRQAIRRGSLGDIFAVDLVFHNAYGPDKPWFYDKAQSGGGCVIDLGVHLVDLALWALEFPTVTDVQSSLFAGGEKLIDRNRVEDYAVATIGLASGTSIRLACSWNLHAGQEAEISARFYGTRGGAAMHNVNGSFYDFVAHLFDGTVSTALTHPPDDWGGRAIAHWAEQCRAARRFDEQAAALVAVARVLDGIYAGSL